MTTRKRNSTRSNNTVPGFLSKTYKILEVIINLKDDPLVDLIQVCLRACLLRKNPEYGEIISWNEDGKAFKVKKPNEFAEKVLPKYFKTNNFASFVRQLNMYDFHKLRHDSEENEWRHKLFRRGFPNLLCEIRRKINEPQIPDAIVVQKEQKKITSDTQFLLKEMLTLKQKQESLEKACGVLIAQNTQILGENKLLWGELNKKKEKSQKKIEKLFSLFFTYIGPKQIPELALMNNKKHSGDFLKHEDLSDDYEEEINPQSMRGDRGNSKQNWGNCDIGNSLNNFPFNSIQQQPHQLTSSFNDAASGLNASNMLISATDNSQIGGGTAATAAVGGSSQPRSLRENDDQQIAQKILDGILKNMKNRQENNNGSANTKLSSNKSDNNDDNGNRSQPSQQQTQQGLQLNSFVDNFHKTNSDMLYSLTHFMNSQGGTSDLNSIDLNNKIAQTMMGNVNTSNFFAPQPTEQQQQKQNPSSVNLKRGAAPDIDPEESLPMVQATTSKRFKKDDGPNEVRFPIASSSAFSQIASSSNNNHSHNNHNNIVNNSSNNTIINNNNTGNNHFSLDEFFSQNNQNFTNNSIGGAAAAGAGDLGTSKASFDFAKLLQGDYSTLVLPMLTSQLPAKQELNGGSPTRKKMLSICQPTIIQSNRNFPIRSSTNNAIAAASATNGSAFMNPHQQSAQWDEFNQFINEQKIEQSLDNSDVASTMHGGKIDEFLNKEDAKLNESLL